MAALALREKAVIAVMNKADNALHSIRRGPWRGVFQNMKASFVDDLGCGALRKRWRWSVTFFAVRHSVGYLGRQRVPWLVGHRVHCNALSGSFP